MRIELYRTRGIDNICLGWIVDSLQKAFPFLEVEVKDKFELSLNFYDHSRGQFNAFLLLEELDQRREGIALLVIEEDLFSQGLNFVFGQANFYCCAVLSIYRLRKRELICKEAVHEVGHVLGLRHCSNDCVMQFSNSVHEAERKSSELCSTCKQKLRERYGGS
jgi:archaemetzincin